MITEVGNGVPVIQTGSNNGMEGGSWIWIIVLFFLFAQGGLGGNNAGGQITNDFLFANLNTTMQNGFAQVDNGIRAVQNGICDSTFALNNSIKDGFYRNEVSLCQGFNGVNNSINSLGFMLKDCCCDIKSAIQAEGCATRELIVQNTLQGLRDELSDAKTTLSNASQSQYILGQVGSYKPYGYCCC